MPRINVLSESVYNKIAAGEVVEKPASVVKELLDNSIDAGATKIQIKVADGGIKNITIIDNGCGIEPDDFDKVFIAHATSKIKTSEDLANIGTLGFRGEALASIASVSNVVLTSKLQSETYGFTCSVSGGKQSDTTEIGANNGTSISVSDLFFNVPARAKFLRKPRTEMNDITTLVEKYILCNPKISFTYIADDKLIYQSTGTSLFDAIYTIYGKSAIDGIIKVENTNPNSHIGISGYIGLPTFSKPNRTYQTLSVNGRYVNSTMVSSCVYSVYEHYLMKGQFPFYILNISIPLDKLDVNVHPNKMEVRFGNSNEIYGNVYNAISTALYNCEKITTTENLMSYKVVENGSSFSSSMNADLESQKACSSKTVEINLLDNDKEFEKPTPIVIKDITQPTIALQEKISFNSDNTNYHFEQQTLLNNTTFIENNGSNRTNEFYNTSDIKFVGTIFATYLIIEKQDKVYMIDEHAGHERLLFDRLVKEVDSRNIIKQSLLAPFILNLNREEFCFIEENLSNLKRMGFDIRQIGEFSYSVDCIPSLLCDIDLKKFFDNVLQDLSGFKELKQSDLILRKLMQHSCKCAVRAGKILSSGEVNSLITQMKEENMQLQCPHGRPVVVELQKKDIEKLFRRIV